MRILQFTTQMEAGGAQGRALNLQNELNRRGHTVETVFFYIKRPVFVGVEGTSSLYDRPIKVWEVPQLLFRIYKKIKAFNPDVVMPYCHWANIMAGLVARCAGYKVVVNQTNPPDKDPKPAHLLDCVWGWAGVYDINITNSKTTYQVMLEKVPKRYKKKLRVVRLGVYLPPGSLSRQAVRQRLEISEDSFLLIHLGRLSLQKNHDALLRAMALLPENVHLICVGDGELKEQLHVLAHSLNLGKRIHWLGERPRSELMDLLKSADMFVFPSLFEGFGLAPVEAAGAGLPLLVNNIPIFHEVMIFEDGTKAAEMVDATKPEPLAMGVRKIMEDQAMRQDLVSRSTKLAEKYSLGKMADDYEKCLREVVQERK